MAIYERRATMSFDLYFVPPPNDGESWEATIERLLSDVESGAATAGEERERQMLAAMDASLAPQERFDGALVMDHNGDALFMVYVEGPAIMINAPYGRAGVDAQNLVDRLEVVARSIQQQTGLVAFDPQSDRPFLDGGSTLAGGFFDQAAQMFARASAMGEPNRQLGRGKKIVFSLGLMGLLLWLASLVVQISAVVVVAVLWWGGAATYEMLDRYR